MIPQDDYIRMVLGGRLMLRALKLMVGDLPLTMDQRRNVITKLRTLCDDNHRMYIDLKEQGLVD